MVCALNIGEKFSLGGITTLLGLGMTFLVLALLIGFVYLISFIVKKVKPISFKKKNQTKQTPEDTAIEVKQVEENVSPEKMLAIESAVKTYLSESSDTPHENIKIISVTKK